MVKKVGAVLVVGGGIAGIQASLDLADSGFKVYLVEKAPSIGGRMAKLDKTFPTNDCAMCILAPKLVTAGRHPNIKLMSNAEVESAAGFVGNYEVTILKKPRYIDEMKCTGCGECEKVCPVELPNEFELGLNNRKAIYRPFPQAVPNIYIIDKKGAPPCRAACPAGVNVQGYVALIAQRKFKEALELIRRDMPLPAVCGRICFHPCENECERGKVDQPLAINALKRFVADYEFEQTTEPLSPSSPLSLTHNEKVAIVGSGPTGLTAAFDLRKKGYPVTVFESLPRPGGMLRVGVPEYRLPRDVLDAEIKHIKDLGVEIRTNVSIGKDLMFNELLQEFDAVFIATGMHKGAKLGIDGEELNGVVNAIDFLREVNLGKKVELGDRVAVICVHRLLSLETARVALRLGPKEVNVIYRRSRKSMLYHERIQERMQKEVEEVEREGAKIHFMIWPTKILGKDGRVVGIECTRMTLGEPDNSGRRQLVPIKGSEFIIELDAVIIAVGQAPDFSFLPKEVELTEKNTIKIDPVTLETSLPGVFAGGEVESGPSTAIASIAAGKRAAVSIDRHLRGENLKAGKEEEIKLVKEVSKEGVEKKARQVMPLLPVEKRTGGFEEVETGFTEEMALWEAERCLNCGGCSECLECEKACKLEGTIIHRQRPERIKINVGAIILAPGFEEFDPCLKKEYGHGRYLNVVSGIEFERILNASGPFGGKILRPFDGKIPRKIAFIQCVGSRDAQLGNNYCSAACCMYGIKEAVIAKEHAPTKLDCTIFYMDMRSYGKEFDAYRDRAREEYGVRFVRSRVAGVAEDPLTGNLFVHYVEDETPKTEEFDMVVLSVGMQPPRNAERLAEILRIKLNKYKFCETDAFSPLETSRPGVFVCGVFAEPKDIPQSVAEASGAAAKAMGIVATERGKLTTVKEYPPERDVSREEPRVGVFVCHCGINIGGVVNVPEVVEYAKALPNVVYAEANLYTCSQDTQKLIREEIQQHNLNRVVVASCTPRTHEPLFRETVQEAGLNPYLFEMANIRDQCSWVHMHEPEKATEKAKDLIRSMVAKARLLKPLKRPMIGIVPVGLVIGGGISGMTAALELAKQGFEVHLVEKEKELGGHLRAIHYLLEERADPKDRLNALIKAVAESDKIHAYTGAEVVDVYGFVGNFKSKIRQQDGKEKEIQHGVVIVATGAVEYKPTEYLYGKDLRVMTQRELEEKIAKGSFKAKNVVMIQCVGARNEERPNCARICCGQAIKNALKIKEVSPETEVYVLYKDVRSYGFREDYYREALTKGVMFINYDDERKPKVTHENGQLKVVFWEPVIGEEVEIEPDVVALSAAVVPNPDSKRVAEMLKVPLTMDGFFLEAHVKLRPVDFATEGVFLCGLAHWPKFINESVAQACGAAGRAATILSRKTLEAEGTVSYIDQNLCIGCGLCISICPYGAIEKDEKELTRVNEVLCKGCGTCAASCPKRAITMHQFTDEQIAAQGIAILRRAAHG